MACTLYVGSSQVLMLPDGCDIAVSHILIACADEAT